MKSRYKIEWLDSQNIPDGEDYDPDVHDVYDHITLTSKASALRLAAIKENQSGWARVTLEEFEPDYFNGVQIGYWIERETIQDPS